ncbi:MAG: hypothetical protein IJU01_05690 [Lachnospiraceae bacterium]|nr:hypothetical protein [Lachnospiraceae bacterium]
MKPSNLSEINKAFTEQAAGFESDKLHLSKQEYLDYTVMMTAPQKTDTVLEVAAGTCVCGRSIALYADTLSSASAAWTCSPGQSIAR